MQKAAKGKEGVAGFARRLRCDAVLVLGFASLLAVMNFLFWGGAFSAASGHPYGISHIFGCFSIPSALVLGAGLLASGLTGTGDKPHSPMRAGALAAVFLVAGLVGLAALLGLPEAHPALLALAACVIGLGLALGLRAWAGLFARLDPASVVTVAGSACLAFPLITALVRSMPSVASFALVGALACLAGAAPVAPVALTGRGGAASGAPDTPTGMAAGQAPACNAPSHAGGPLPSPRELVSSYGTQVASFGVLGFIAGFARISSLGSGADSQAVTVGTLVGIAVVGALVLGRWYLAGKILTAQSYYLLAFPVAATGFLLFTVLDMGFSSAFAWFADFFFEFMLIVVAIDATRGQGGPERFCAASGVAFSLVGLGTVAGWAARALFSDSGVAFGVSVAVCVYALSMPLVLQLRSRNPHETTQGPAEAEGDPSGLLAAEPLAFGMPGPSAQSPAAKAARKAALDSAATHYSLTPREREILELTLEGVDSPGVADALGLSDNTVRTHKKSLYRKLDVHSKAELADAVRQATAGADAREEG